MYNFLSFFFQLNCLQRVPNLVPPVVFVSRDWCVRFFTLLSPHVYVEEIAKTKRKKVKIIVSHSGTFAVIIVVTKIVLEAQPQKHYPYFSLFKVLLLNVDKAENFKPIKEDKIKE